MVKEPTIDALWDAPAEPAGDLRADALAALPESARLLLRHALPLCAPLATRVRLRMRGELRLRGWMPFEAEQVIHADRGMIWNARVRMKGLPVTGFDRLIDGVGRMRWRLLGLLPVADAEGPDVTRSAAGRLHAELIWLPSALVRPEVGWSVDPQGRAVSTLATAGHIGEVTYCTDAEGRVVSLEMERWGDPDGEGYRALPFGAVVEQERTFDGTTVPSRVRVGWHFTGDRFEGDGEFFRATIEDVAWRC